MFGHWRGEKGRKVVGLSVGTLAKGMRERVVVVLKVGKKNQ